MGHPGLELQKAEKKSWWVVEFDVDSKNEELASWLMIQCGSNGCQWISTEGEKVTLQASFEDEKLSPLRLNFVYAQMDEYGLAAVIPSMRINKIEEQDWLLEWKKGIEPLPMGNRFLICPPWLESTLTKEQSAGRFILLIEPGMAFGTGYHFTTQYCLRTIENHASKGSILDVGTGSGILAIAAMKLIPGAKVWACETDPVACEVARENFQLNKVDDDVRLVEGSTEKFAGEKFDLILSNLTCEDNVALLKDYADMLNAGGKVIMSGILKEKLSRLESALAEHPFEVVEIEEQDTWAGVVVKRKGN